MCQDSMKQKLLVSIRGKNEALKAYKGGANIIDVEYPASALGTPYPLNIKAVRNSLPKKVEVATNIGEEQLVRSTACQAALGVALAGADIIKVGLAKYPYKEATYLGKNVVRTIKEWFPNKKIILAIFADKNLRKIFNPIRDGHKLGLSVKADGILIDTFNKSGKDRLTDLMSQEEIKKFVKNCHSAKLEAWIAGSITIGELPALWKTGVDVICIRGAACLTGSGRMGKISSSIVKRLVATIPIPF